MIYSDSPSIVASPEISAISERERILRESLGSMDVWAWEYRLGQSSPVFAHATESILGGRATAFTRFLQLIRPEDRFRIQFGIQKSLRLRQGFVFECFGLALGREAGSKIQIQGNYIATGGGGMYRGFVQNISSHRSSAKVTQDDRFRSLFRQSEVNFRLLSESLPQIVWIEDENGFVYYLNQQWVDYTGRSIEESLGRGWFESIHPDDRSGIISAPAEGEASEPIMASPPWKDVVQRIRMRDGSYRWFLSRGVPVYAENGEIVRWLGTSTDIDAQKKIEQELDDARMIAISANESKSAFLANMSHEIRTPLGIILGYCELLKRPGVSPEQQAEFLSSMTKNGQDLSMLIDNILDLSKIEAEKMDVERHPFHIREQLEAIVKSLRIKAEEKGIALHLEIDSDVPHFIPTDEIRFRQILINIVGNAIKFTEEGSVSLHVQKPAGEEVLIIDVADTGCGMEAHQTDRLFKAFSQVDATSTRRHGGTGLGLMLSKLLAKALGGDVILAATCPTQGSVFRISVSSRPSSLAPEVAPLKEAPLTESHALQGLRILLAEDALDNQFIFSTFLRAEGAEVDVVENGLEAVEAGLEAVEAGLKANYDLILMDIQMPVMDGYDATRRLRASGYEGPILALSAHALIEDSSKSKLAGCDDHIAKPVDFARLVSTILEYAARAEVRLPSYPPNERLPREPRFPA